MWTANDLVRYIFGFSRSNISPLVISVEIAYDLMFHQGKSRNDIKMMRDIYQQAADELRMKSGKTAARRIERLCNRCWDRIQEDEELLKRLVGSHTKELDASSEVIFLLACYIKYEKPFREVLEHRAALTF